MTMAKDGVLDYGYDHVALSEALTDAEYAIHGAAGATLTGATYTSDTLTLGANNVDCFELNDVCRFIRINDRAGAQDLTVTGGDVQRFVRTQPNFEAPAEFVLDDDAEGSWGLIYKDPEGHRLLHVETTDGQKITAVVQMFDVERMPQPDNRGRALIGLTFRNSGKTKPVWED